MTDVAFTGIFDPIGRQVLRALQVRSSQRRSLQIQMQVVIQGEHNTIPQSAINALSHLFTGINSANLPGMVSSGTATANATAMTKTFTFDAQLLGAQAASAFSC